MRRLAVLLSVVVAAGAAPSVVLAQGGEPVARTFAAPFDTVWDVTLATLKSLGWDIDTDDKKQGTIVTDDEKVDFKDFGVYGEGSRHKLRVTVKPVTEARTMVTVSREVFTEKRYLWVKERKPVQAADRSVETSVLDAIVKAGLAASPAAAGVPPAPGPPVAPPPPALPPGGTPEGGRGEFTYKVTYVVKGTARGAMLTYRNPRGGTEQTSVRLPWESSFTVKGGEFLYISVQNEGTSGSVTCEILLDGVSRTNATSSGAYVIAECSSAAGRN